MWPWGSGLFLADNGRNEKPRPLRHVWAIVCCDVFNPESHGSFMIFSSRWRPLTVCILWGGWRFWGEMAPKRRPQCATRGSASSSVGDAIPKRGNWNLLRKEFSVCSILSVLWNQGKYKLIPNVNWGGRGCCSRNQCSVCGGECVHPVWDGALLLEDEIWNPLYKEQVGGGVSLPSLFLRAELSARKLPHASASSGCHRGSSCCHQAPPLLPLQPLEFEEDNLHCWVVWLMQAASVELPVWAQSFCPSSARLLSVAVPENEDFLVGLRGGTGEAQAVFTLIGLTPFPCSVFLATPQEMKSWTSCSREVLPLCLTVWVTGMQECCKDGCL